MRFCTKSKRLVLGHIYYMTRVHNKLNSDVQHLIQRFLKSGTNKGTGTKAIKNSVNGIWLQASISVLISELSDKDRRGISLSTVQRQHFDMAELVLVVRLMLTGRAWDRLGIKVFFFFFNI
ncbi:hypothetical protein CIPAW_01G130300 [Carya illinoinensis]|uniref:Uncharacterized protein n=1 Tax=Carya illinoinensis TaxID=32201 RepID=A0A8T1RPR6_CARIL|nr:hypothetical protein CIPAW_01G130300 [Carya illinoinensis]